MDDARRIRTSRFLSLVLRHRPERIGITLDAAGWVEIDELLAKCTAHGQPLDRAALEHVVAHCDKQRFAISPCGSRVRASQGHSTDVALGYAASEPPDTLFHGTTERAVAAIRREGLRRMQRHHVHLSADEATAARVGERRGPAVVLRVDAAAMRRAGHVFFVSANGVWLTDSVPAEFVNVPDGS